MLNFKSRFLSGNKIFEFEIEIFIWKQNFLNLKSRFLFRNTIFKFEIKIFCLETRFLNLNKIFKSSTEIFNYLFSVHFENAMAPLGHHRLILVNKFFFWKLKSILWNNKNVKLKKEKKQSSRKVFGNIDVVKI